MSGDSDVKWSGQDIELTVGAEHSDDEFTVADVIVHYDPLKLEFMTETNGTHVALADSAIESLIPNFSIMSAVKESEGQIRIIMTTAGEQYAASGSGPLFKLYGKIKSTAVQGGTSVSLSNFEISMNGAGSSLDASRTSFDIDIHLSDKAALISLIANAKQTLDGAVIGSQPGQYPQSAVNALTAQIQTANVVLANSAATQTEVSQAVAALQAALSTFASSVNGAPIADVDALNAAIAAAESKYAGAVAGTKIGQYSDVSKAALQTAINAAKAVRNNVASSQPQVDQAVTALNQASDTFSATIITLVPNATKITIHDLSIIAKYFGTKQTDANWTEIEKADLLGHGEITIEVLAAVARMILDDWFAK